MNVSLTPKLESFVRETVEAGLYNNASEVMREALRLLRDKEMKKQELFKALDASFEDLKAGRYTTYKPEVLTQITEDVIARNKK